MRHAKFQDHRTSCSGEEVYQEFSPYVGPSIISSTNSMSYLFLDISSRYLAYIIDDIIGP